MFITHDIEIVRSINKYRVSDNPYTGTSLVVTSYNVKGAGYDRSFQTVDRINGRFKTAVREDKKVVELGLRYRVEKPAYAAHLKSEVQRLFQGEFYLRELATNSNKIPFLNFDDPNHEFDLDYVDGRQIYVGLVSDVSFDTTKTSGEFTLEFETINLPYFESIGYSTDLENDPNLNLWGADEDVSFNKQDLYRKCTFTNVGDGWLYSLSQVPINQFTQDMRVEITLSEDTSEFRFYIADSDLMEIIGLKLKKGDKIVFDGLHTYRNGLSIDDYAFGPQPTINPGGNNFHFNQYVAKVIFKYKLYFR